MPFIDDLKQISAIRDTENNFVDKNMNSKHIVVLGDDDICIEDQK